MTPALTIIGIALWGQLICGLVGFVIGRITAKRGPCRIVEVYEGEGVPF
jgi:hypothetical protein